MPAPYRLDRKLIRVGGPDSHSFLQGLLTQDVDRLEAARVLYAALLSPQGKLIADMLLWADREGVILDVDPSRGAALLQRLSMYKLRANVTIEDVSGAATALWSPEPLADGAVDPRFPDGALGWRALHPAATAAVAAPNGDALYRARRLMLGVPDLAADAEPEEVFGLEALLEELNGVAFQKGCFVGQENVSRMKRRATTRKKFCPLNFEGASPSYGTPVLAGEAEVGSVRSGMDGRAIALVRLDRATAAGSLTAGGHPVRLDPPGWLILPRSTDG